MKTIYSSSEIANLWLRGDINSASTSGRNFYFNGESIYSYGPHFIIAREAINGGKAQRKLEEIIKFSQKYSC